MLKIEEHTEIRSSICEGDAVEFQLLFVIQIAGELDRNLIKNLNASIANPVSLILES